MKLRSNPATVQRRQHREDGDGVLIGFSYFDLGQTERCPHPCANAGLQSFADAH